MVLSVGIGVMFPRLRAQSDADAKPRPAFEVASVKANKSGQGFIAVRPSPGGRFTITNAPLRVLITLAYRLKDFQVSGGPGWISSDRFDITAKAEGNAKFEEMLPMLQTLLESRFQLKIHRDTKEVPVYALVVSKPGKLHQSEGECPAATGPPPPPEPGKPPGLPCGGIFMFPGRFGGEKISISQLVDSLSRLSGRVVLDKTGLTGRYDVSLEYTPDSAQLKPPPGGPPDAGPPPGLPPLPPIDPNGPSLFTALQEQLGLKLESQKGPVEMLVIDSVQQPSED
ncbi:MAG: TIGR03435 family protein [Acidobacteriia bacterium]|nr:TIGR03435 family protein [Terriglobia bacterium]